MRRKRGPTLCPRVCRPPSRSGGRKPAKGPQFGRDNSCALADCCGRARSTAQRAYSRCPRVAQPGQRQLRPPSQSRPQSEVASAPPLHSYLGVRSSSGASIPLQVLHHRTRPRLALRLGPHAPPRQCLGARSSTSCRKARLSPPAIQENARAGGTAPAELSSPAYGRSGTPSARRRRRWGNYTRVPRRPPPGPSPKTQAP